MEEKLAIIMSGEGMKSSFTGGVLIALAEKYNITEPFLVIGGSGSAGNGAYFIARQYDSIRNIWGVLLSSKKFLCLLRFWKIIDIDYLIDEVFKKQEPLDTDKILNSKTKFLIPALNRLTGKIDYLCNHEGANIFEGLRATKALPIAFKLNPKIEIGRALYCDSILSARTRTHIKKAVEMGANKILIINSSMDYERSVKSPFLRIWMFFQKCKKAYYQNEKKLTEYQVPENIKIFTLQPKSKIKIRTLGNNKKLLQRTIAQGYKETVNNKELQMFLSQ